VGTESPEGTYFYLAKIVTIYGQEYTEKGTLILIR
jgi:hypothetical protein